MHGHREGSIIQSGVALVEFGLSGRPATEIILRTLTIIIFAFIALPLVELALLLYLGNLTAWYFPLVVVIVTGILGGVLAKMQGTTAFRRIIGELRTGRMPGDALFDAGLILFAGGLLLTPGMLTDATGFALLIPPSRQIIKRWIVHWFRRKFDIPEFRTGGGPDGAGGSPTSQPGPRDVVIDSEVVERPESVERSTTEP